MRERERERLGTSRGFAGSIVQLASIVRLPKVGADGAMQMVDIREQLAPKAWQLPSVAANVVRLPPPSPFVGRRSFSRPRSCKPPRAGSPAPRYYLAWPCGKSATVRRSPQTRSPDSGREPQSSGDRPAHRQCMHRCRASPTGRRLLPPGSAPAAPTPSGVRPAAAAGDRQTCLPAHNPRPRSGQQHVWMASWATSPRVWGASAWELLYSGSIRGRTTTARSPKGEGGRQRQGWNPCSRYL